MRYEERINDLEELLRLAMDGRQSQIHTNQPGIIVSFNPATHTASVQPSIKGRVQKQDGTVSYEALPIIPDVPVSFPGGGGATLTFPIKAGDECWLSHSHRDISAWWQSGGIQQPFESRMHDLSDCVAHVGIRSARHALPGGSSNSSTQLRSDDGKTVIELTNGQIVNIIAPMGMKITTPMLTVSGQIVAVGDVTGGPGNISLVHHTHKDSMNGATTPPIPV